MSVPTRKAASQHATAFSPASFPHNSHLKADRSSGPHLRLVTLPVLLNGLDKTASISAAKQIVITSASIAAHVSGLVVDTAACAFKHVRCAQSVPRQALSRPHVAKVVLSELRHYATQLRAILGGVRILRSRPAFIGHAELVVEYVHQRGLEHPGEQRNRNSSADHDNR